MIEYLYNCIRVTSGESIDICAVIEDDSGTAVTEGCRLSVFDAENVPICGIDGVFSDDMWTFTIPADMTEGLRGRYWYSFGQSKRSLCFKQPIYFVG